MSQKFILNILLISLLVVSGCKFRKIQKSADWKEKYEAAVNYYNEEDYYHANILFEEIIPLIRGTEEAELANFYFAYTYFYQKQYLLSAHHFKSFTEIYARSDYAMEAMYMSAYSLYLQSPEASLDQTSTLEAVAELQAFINKYPYTELAEKADDLIDELRVKLETKAYENTKLYFKIRRYKAALVAAETFKVEYPDSKYIPEIMYLSIESAYELAFASIRSKQEERLRDTINRYEELIDKYPDSKYVKMAEKFYEESIEQLAIFANQNNTDQ